MDSPPEGTPISKMIEFEEYSLYHEGVSGRKRGCNFNVDEDRLLVAAWLHPSLDATISHCSKSSSYWKRIENYFILRKDPNWPQRSVSSLSHRWSHITQSVKRFCYFLTQVGELNKSDALNEFNIQAARMAFHSVTKQPFRFEHCWELLKNEQKWIDLCSKQAAPKKKPVEQLSPLNPEYSNPEFIDDATDDLHGICEEDIDERTPRKKAKNLRKTLLSDNSSHSTLSNVILELENGDKKSNVEKMLNFGMFKSSPSNPICSNSESIDEATDELHLVSEEDHDDERTPGKKDAVESKNLGKTLLNDGITLSNAFLELENVDKRANEEKMLEFNLTSYQAQFLEIRKAELFETKERNQIKNEKLQLEVSKLKLQQSKEDVEIMMKDTSKMDPEQKEYFRIRRMEILRRASALI